MLLLYYYPFAYSSILIGAFKVHDDNNQTEIEKRCVLAVWKQALVNIDYLLAVYNEDILIGSFNLSAVMRSRRWVVN